MLRNLIIIILVFLGAVGVMLMGNVIVIGDKIGEVTHVYVEYAFYVVLLVLFIVFVLRPIIKVLRAPEFPRLQVDESWDINQLRLFGKRLAKNCDYISDKTLRSKHKEELVKSIDSSSENKEELQSVIEKEIGIRMNGDETLQVRGINNRIKEWGKTVFMVTAISQNSKIDSVAVLLMNHKMITDIINASGFRPTKPQLFKIYVKVLTTALISYCTSYVFTDIDGVAPFDLSDGEVPDIDDVAMDGGIELDGDEYSMLTIINNLKKSRIAGLFFDSAIEGCINALMTLRIGYVTKSYITQGAKALSGTKDKRRVKRQAMVDAFKAMPGVILSGGVVLGDTVKNLLVSIFERKGKVSLFKK